jgi:hypothetical protein
LQRLKARNARSAQFESVFGACELYIYIWNIDLFLLHIDLDLVDKVLAHNSFSSRALRSGSSSGIDASRFECSDQEKSIFILTANAPIYRRNCKNCIDERHKTISSWSTQIIDWRRLKKSSIGHDESKSDLVQPWNMVCVH